MIPDFAIIVSTYAIARLVNEYAFESAKLRPLRVLVAGIAIAVIGTYLAQVLEAGSSLSDLGL